MTSIRRRLLAGIGLGVSLAFVASGVLVVVLARASLVRQFDAHLTEQVSAMSALVEQEGDALDAELGLHTNVTRRPEYFELWDGHGSVVVRSASLDQRDLARTSTSEHVAHHDVTLPDGRSGRQVTLRFTPRQDAEEGPASPSQTAVLVLARGVEDIDDTATRIGTVVAGVGVAGTLLCGLILFMVVAYGLRPLRQLASSIALIEESDLQTRIATASTPLELRPVVERLDEMLARLAAAFARERELTAEVAHELRTPLAGLRSTIEVAIYKERTADRYRTALVDCLAIAAQAERTVESMLSLARLDAGAVSLDVVAVEMDELVREVLAPLTSRATQRGLTLTTKLDPVSISTDREKIRTVVHNLIENAVVYADENGAVDISLVGSRLVVTNTCTGLVPEDASRVFERFWRNDASRTGGVHAGLGLAITKKLVDRLGGTIAAEVTDDQFVATLAFENLQQG